MRLALPNLFSLTEKGATIVFPSPLLASAAREQLTARHLADGLESWQRPAIYSRNAWLKNCWNEARYKSGEVQTLLSESQERLLWQQIIEREHAHLFDSAGTAQLAMRASALIEEWRIPADAAAWGDYEDSQQFHHWRRQFRRTCFQEGWIAQSDLWTLLPGWIASGLCAREFTVFAGFPRLAPALDPIRHALGLFSAIEETEPARTGALATAQCCVDISEELERAARWARAALETAPHASIAVFVPGLRDLCALVERTFDRVFYPSAALRLTGNRSTEERCIFHVHASTPLEHQPLIANALLILQLIQPRIGSTQAGAILRCPFVSGASAERSLRALADIELRRKRDLDVTLGDLQFATKNCPALSALWPRVRTVLSKKHRTAGFFDWSELCSELLQAVGWPGDADLGKDEQEIVEAWNRALSELAALELVSKEVPFPVALTQLRRLLRSSGMERGNWLSPVQICEASEAAGLRFDQACITGLGEETWPPPPLAHALVPLKLQRAAHVPGSSPEDARRERERLTAALFSAAGSVPLTYSGRLSPLAKRFVSGENGFPQWSGKLPRDAYVPAKLLELEDSMAPPYTAIEPARGGTALIKAQSLCPFRAFAEFRLHAQRPEDACFGFDARDRGGFLHRALQNVWSELHSSDRLRSIVPEELRQLVHHAVSEAVKQDEPSPFHQLISITERERLEELILDWLNDIERCRKQSFTVQTVEQDRVCEIAGLQLKLRVDRIDRLNNGNVLLIDYKSGEQKSTSLEGERPKEPQLLVYAATCDERVDGVFFAQLKARELRAVGFSRDVQFPGRAVKVRRDWPSFVAESEAEVHRLAADFMRGNAVVDPLRGACDYCGVTPFCRINEENGQPEDAD